MNYRKFLIVVLLVMFFVVQVKDIIVICLMCEMCDGRVIIFDIFCLGWQMSLLENGMWQIVYEIEIWDVWVGKVVWNSGKVKFV